MKKIISSTLYCLKLIIRIGPIKKIVFILNIPSPYQIAWAKKLKERYDIEFWFLGSIQKSTTGRPNYWNIEMPSYCRHLPSYFQMGERFYCPSINSELDQFDPDIVVIGGWHMIGCYQAFRWAKKNRRFTATAPWEFSARMSKIKTIIRNKFIYNWIYRGIDLFLANGYIHYDYFKMYLGKKNVKIFCNFDDYTPYLDHPVRQNNEVITFMYGGAIDRRMRVPELLHIFERLSSRYKNIKLIIGGYGPEKSQCEEIVQKSLLLSSNVKFWNVKTWEEVASVYKNCDVLVNYASFSPGAGVVYSAIASGMGLITTTTIHAARSYVSDGYNGFLVDDDDELFSALQRYIKDKSLLKRHSLINKNIGLKCLTLDNHLDEFTSILDARYTSSTSP